MTRRSPSRTSRRRGAMRTRGHERDRRPPERLLLDRGRGRRARTGALGRGRRVLGPARYGGGHGRPRGDRARAGAGLHGLTPTEAQRLHDEARIAGRWLMWFVSYEHSGKFIARAHTADPHGGKWLPGVRAADTLDTLRAMLPPGLTRRERTSVMSAEVLEVW